MGALNFPHFFTQFFVCPPPHPPPPNPRRKFLTIVLSVVRFGHPMSTLQWSGVSLVFGGLVMEAAHKYQMQKQRQDKDKDKAKAA